MNIALLLEMAADAAPDRIAHLSPALTLIVSSLAGYGFEGHFVARGMSSVLLVFTSVIIFLLARYCVTYYKGDKRGGV